MASHYLIDRRQISVLNVATILSEVHRYTIGACLFRHDDGIGRTWVARASGLPQRGDVINIHAE
jgi:hypothetical protein